MSAIKLVCADGYDSGWQGYKGIRCRGDLPMIKGQVLSFDRANSMILLRAG